MAGIRRDGGFADDGNRRTSNLQSSVSALDEQSNFVRSDVKTSYPFMRCGATLRGYGTGHGHEARGGKPADLVYATGTGDGRSWGR